QEDNGLGQDYFSAPRITTADYNNVNEHAMTQDTFEQYRHQLIVSIQNDKVLTDIICERIVHSYSTDLIRTYCTMIENNFDNNLIQYQQAVEFVSRWLLHIEDNDRQSLDGYSNKNIWLLAHIYTTFEYEQNDLISMYSAIRIINRIYSTRLSY
ncbi:unnamed protein product, partial [Rotaria sp. Silwood2]